MSEKRASNIFDYIDRRIELPDTLATYTYLGRDWKGLRAMVEADENTPGREDVLRLLDEIITAVENGADQRDFLGRLMRSGNGMAYGYMYAKMFPELRKSSLQIEWGGPKTLRAEVAEERPAAGLSLLPPSSAIVPASLGVIEPIDTKWQMSSESRNFYMALKTNMLYDLAAVPNLSAEFYLGKNWSIAGEGAYAWWSKNSRHRYWRVYGGDITVRRWFGAAADRKPLTGHHVGAYAGAVTFDVEWGGTGYMGGIPRGTLLDRCLLTAGVEYGYSLPIGRRLNIDFTIAVGWIGGKCIKYRPEEDFYVEEVEKRVDLFVPTKAEISLVWLIGRGNVNPGKGGRR